MPTGFEQTELVSTPIPVPSEPSELSGTERPIYDEIVIEQPPIGHAFTTYGPLAVQPDPVSFQDAMSQPDHEFWWKAFCDEIVAIINNRTWELINLPLGTKAIPLK